MVFLLLENIPVLPSLGICEHLLLSFLLYRELRRRISPKILAYLQQDFPELARFFQLMEKDLKSLYPLVDNARAQTGRPPLCHHFQLRFFIFYFLAGFASLTDALDHVNNSREWQKILRMPVKRYHPSTLSRFLNRIGEDTWQVIEGRLIRVLLKYRLISLKHVLIDGFPIISYLNTQKCLKHFSFDQTKFIHFFRQLDVTPILNVLPQRRKCKFTPELYLRLLIFQHLWGYSSTTHFFKVLRKKPLISLVLAGSSPIPVYETYRNYIRTLKTSAQWPTVKWFLEEVLRNHPDFTLLGTEWEMWQGGMDNPHQLNDPGACLNHCASKNMTYHGREGVVLVDGESELPLFGHIQSGARIGKKEFQEIIELADLLLPPHKKVQHLIGDGEFDTDANEELCWKQLGTCLIRPVEQENSMNRRLPEQFFRLRLGVERSISRIEGLNKVARPCVLGSTRVKSYVHMGVISLQLAAIYSTKIGHKEKCRSIKWLRQKKGI